MANIFERLLKNAGPLRQHCEGGHGYLSAGPPSFLLLQEVEMQTTTNAGINHSFFMFIFFDY